MVGRKIAASLMCVVVALIVASPLAQSSPGVHEIVKYENGPPSTCAESWGVTPSKDWTWHGHIVNYGLKWLIIDVIDTETGDILIDREMYRFGLYPEGWVDTEKIDLVAGHTYWITATPMGPIGSWCTVEDVLEGAPLAAFTVSVDGATVFVDASASYDPDGAILSYHWDWGDGTTGTGVTATHTYVVPEGTVAASTSTLGIPQPPYFIYGVTKDVVGNPLPNCMVTVTNDNNGGFLVTESDADGKYLSNIANMGESYPYADGDLIIVEAVSGSLSLSGVSQGYVDLSGYLTNIDVVLEPGNVRVITLTVMDDDNLTETISQPVALEHVDIPPVASFTVYVNGSTVYVDASSSYDPDGVIVSYYWDWGDGTDGIGETAEHTYTPPEPEMLLDASDSMLGGPGAPYIVYGYTSSSTNVPLPFCTVTVTNVDQSCSAVVESDSSGFYSCDISNMGQPEPFYDDGDEILVEAVKDGLSGSAVGYVDLTYVYTHIDVILDEGQPAPFEVTITLTVTDNDGLESSVSQTVTLYP